MKIDFYKPNEQLAPTVANYLFSDEYASIMNGQYVEQDGKHYQVTGITLPDDPSNSMAVFIYPVNRPGKQTDIHLD